MTHINLICNGYNKYHLWTGLFHDIVLCPFNPKWQRKTIKERKQEAVRVYLQLLGKNYERLDRE